MNSWTELLSRCGGDLSSGDVSVAWPFSSSGLCCGEKEFDATRRVYSQPKFKQNLQA